MSQSIPTVPSGNDESTSANLSPGLPDVPPFNDAQGEDFLLTPTAQRTAKVLVPSAVMIGHSMELPGASSMTSSCTRTLPGPKSIISPAFRPLCEALTSQLLVSRAHVAVGRARKKPWIAFYEQTLGIVPTLQPAVMASFLPYSNE